MPDTLIDTPEKLDAAIAASQHAHRERLLRAVRNQRRRTWIAFVCVGGVAIVALLAMLPANDSMAARIIAMMACVFSVFTYFASKAGRKKTVQALREWDQRP